MRATPTPPRDVTCVCWLDGSRTESVIQTSIETDVWVPDPDNSPYLRRVRARTVSEVHAMLVALMTEPDPRYPEQLWIGGAEEYFSADLINPDRDWPSGRTIVFPVVGGSEGAVSGECPNGCGRRPSGGW